MSIVYPVDSKDMVGTDWDPNGRLKGVKNEINNEINGGGCIGSHAIAG
jgi:hypothetical protein